MRQGVATEADDWLQVGGLIEYEDVLRMMGARFLMVEKGGTSMER